MNKILYSAVVLAAMTACAEQYSETYNIQGSSSVSVLDGSKLYLRAVRDKELKDIDSCEVVHGEFVFSGKLDTTGVAVLSINDGIPPVLIIEKGDIRVNIDRMGHRVSGTPMNEQLYDYIDKLLRLNNQTEELGRKQIQMMLDGQDERDINALIAVEHEHLMMQADSLETHFILDNLDNVLGPCAFQLMTSRYNYPVLTPQIEEILAKATDKFKADAYVSEYVSTAKDIMARLKGEVEDGGSTPTATSSEQQP